MKFCSLLNASAGQEILAEEHRTAKKVDVFRMGKRHLFFRRGLKIYYIAFSDIDRFFRRVLQVPVRISCCGGEMGVEHLVICAGGEELAVILLRDPRMAPSVMEELKERAPHAQSGKPSAKGGGKSAP